MAGDPCGALQCHPERPEFFLLTASSLLTMDVQAMQTTGEGARSWFSEMFAICGLLPLPSTSREQLFQQPTTAPPASLNQLEFPVTEEPAGSHTTLPPALRNRSPLPSQLWAWQPHLICSVPQCPAAVALQSRCCVA